MNDSWAPWLQWFAGLSAPVLNVVDVTRDFERNGPSKQFLCLFLK